MTEVTPIRLGNLTCARDWFADFHPDELNAAAVVEIPEEEVREALKMVYDPRTVGRFTK